MPRCTESIATDRRRPRLRALCTDDRGQVVVETALVMIVLMVFLLLAPVVWKIWMGQQRAQTEAHRSTFYKMFIKPTFSKDPMDLPKFVTNPPSVAYKLAGLPYHEKPKFPPGLGDVSVRAPGDLSFKKFPNQYVEGWSYVPVYYYTSGFAGFRGEIKTARYGAVMRPPWTRMGFPFLPSQTFK